MANPISDTVSVETFDEAQLATASPSFLKQAWRGLWSAIDWLFGLGAIVLGLAILSVIPVLNFLSLGYLLEVSGRVAKSGRMRDGFVGIRKASVIGNVVAGTWLVLLPVRFVAGMWRDAELIEAGSAIANGWKMGFFLISAWAVIHILWACIRGGRLSQFLWPAPLRFIKAVFRREKRWDFGDRFFDYLKDLQLPHYFWLGARGFAGAVIWLIVPVGILLLASGIENPGPAVLVAMIGGLLLLSVALYLPFLQAHFGRENRFRAMFEVRQVRVFFRRAPFAFWLALFITLLFAIPLYLLKIELTPRDLAWLPSLLFVVFIFPARILTGWAMGRALKHEQPRFFLFRWVSRLGAVAVAGAYALIVYLTQYLSWHGTWSLLEQHAFLVPAPMMGL